MTLWYGTFGTGGPKYPQGMVPGAMPLFAALGGRVAFLSARPTRGLLQNDIGLAEATVLPSSLGTIVRSLFQPDKASHVMAEQKAETVVQFAALYPEARFVFIGDSGEGDIEFANVFMRCEGNGTEQDVTQRVALVHDVTDWNGVRPRSNKIERASLQVRGIFVFDTYAGAAIVLHRLGFLDHEGLKIVAQGCAKEFSEIRQENFASLEVFRARSAEFSRDLQEVNAALREIMPCSEDTSLLSADVGPANRTAAEAAASDAFNPQQESAGSLAMPSVSETSSVADAGYAETASVGVSADAAEVGTEPKLLQRPSTSTRPRRRWAMFSLRMPKPQALRMVRRPRPKHIGVVATGRRQLSWRGNMEEAFCWGRTSQPPARR